MKEAEEYFQRRMDHITKQIEMLQPTAADKVKLRESKLVLYMCIQKLNGLLSNIPIC